MNSYVIIVVRIKINLIIIASFSKYIQKNISNRFKFNNWSFICFSSNEKSFRIWTLIGINCYKIISFCNIILLPAINVLKIYILLNFLKRLIPKSEVFLIISFELYIFEFKENLFILFIIYIRYLYYKLKIF